MLLNLGHSRVLEHTRMSNFVLKECSWDYAKIPSSKLTARFGNLFAKVSVTSLSPFPPSSPSFLISSPFSALFLPHLSSLPPPPPYLFTLSYFLIIFRVVLLARIAVSGQKVWLSTKRRFLSQSGTLASTCWGLTYLQGTEQTPPGSLLDIDWAKISLGVYLIFTEQKAPGGLLDKKNMDVCVGKDVYTVELVAKDATLQDYVRSKVNDGGREVSGKWSYTCLPPCVIPLYIYKQPTNLISLKKKS